MPSGESLRLAELLVGLSLVADVGMGLDPGESARACLIATRLADELDAPDRPAVYYTTLLQHVGCTAYAHEAAALLGGDEIAVKSAALRTDFNRPREIITGYLPQLAPEAGVLTRLRAAGVAAARSKQIVDGYSRANCEADAAAGRLDPDAVGAVIEAAGQVSPRVPRPAGLTSRQVEVLRLLARGLSNPEIARELVVSRRTAEHHVQDIYARIGVSSRAAAALYAMEHDLLA